MEGLLQSHDSHALYNEISGMITTQHMFSAFNGLKGELKRDGNQWCATCGEWPEHNISGFGHSPNGAMYEWYKEYYKTITNEPQSNPVRQ